jgi:hypothetical protein
VGPRSEPEFWSLPYGLEDRAIAANLKVLKMTLLIYNNTHPKMTVGATHRVSVSNKQYFMDSVQLNIGVISVKQ